MKELEVRIIDIDIEDIRKKLFDLNTELVKKENQINNIYDYPKRTLLNNKGYARIRSVDDLLNNEKRIYMTVKKLVSQEKYKIMDEFETLIEDEIQGKKIFEALGLELIESIQKYRESYKFKNSLIEIDINDKSFCPFPYIEIESHDENELEEIVTLLGYTMNDTTSSTIYELLNNKGVVKGL